MSLPIAKHPVLPAVAGPNITTAPNLTSMQVPAHLFGTLGADGTFSVGKAALWTANTAAFMALVYHGYKRNDSVGWALMWGLLGGLVWPITVPVALAQGFGKRKR
jgi:hypothetical protein